jgi:hypothetical protein
MRHIWIQILHLNLNSNITENKGNKSEHIWIRKFIIYWYNGK